MSDRNVYLYRSELISALGPDAASAWERVSGGHSGLKPAGAEEGLVRPQYTGAIDPSVWAAVEAEGPAGWSRFERLLQHTIRRLDVPESMRPSVLILSTTKGNIEWLGKRPDAQTELPFSAERIAAHFGIPEFRVVSNACTSGVVAIQAAADLIRLGKAEHVLVAGCDLLSEFVQTGFQAFQAVSALPCRPFDAARDGISLGEACGVVLLSAQRPQRNAIRIKGYATTNDANHISGPSRTGAELALAIRRALGPEPSSSVALISAHGTGTVYNDEMESKAFTLCGMQRTPLHSLKGYTGHTLGAAGIIETILLAKALQERVTIVSAGFGEPGVPEPVNVSSATIPLTSPIALKTASGFGGCNAALVIEHIPDLS